MFIKRHRVTRDDGSFFNPGDFSVGDTVSIYGRNFYLVDADSFTREFMAARGKEQGGPLPYPGDPVDVYRATFGMNRGRAPQAREGETSRAGWEASGIGWAGAETQGGGRAGEEEGGWWCVGLSGIAQ